MWSSLGLVIRVAVLLFVTTGGAVKLRQSLSPEQFAFQDILVCVDGNNPNALD
jgi:hypothetical protein